MAKISFYLKKTIEKAFAKLRHKLAIKTKYTQTANPQKVYSNIAK